mmetsp:Transcript_30442/g.73441  ORF Transcript_30442/g.73441 Transcript_30442/m.73441 type:complete len:115 (-) Transcript_30442:1782-2126(-)
MLLRLLHRLLHRDEVVLLYSLLLLLLLLMLMLMLMLLNILLLVLVLVLLVMVLLVLLLLLLLKGVMLCKLLPKVLVLELLNALKVRQAARLQLLFRDPPGSTRRHVERMRERLW